MPDEDEMETEQGEEENIEEEEPRIEFGQSQRTTDQTVYVDTGRGEAVAVSPGAPFQATLERLAEEAHYGGYFRIFLNGSEVVNPEDSPELIEAGMRIAITSCENRGCVPTNSGKAEMLILSQVGA